MDQETPGIAKPQHDEFCALAAGPCCPWMGDCACQCLCGYIEAIRKDERENMHRELELSKFKDDLQPPDIVCGIGPLEKTQKPSSHQDEEACPHCGEKCWIPHPMSEDTERVYVALFREGPLEWSEDEDCDMRDLMYEMAEAAAKALRASD